ERARQLPGSSENMPSLARRVSVRGGYIRYSPHGAQPDKENLANRVFYSCYEERTGGILDLGLPALLHRPEPSHACCRLLERSTRGLRDDGPPAGLYGAAAGQVPAHFR